MCSVSYFCLMVPRFSNLISHTEQVWLGGWGGGLDNWFKRRTDFPGRELSCLLKRVVSLLLYLKPPSQLNTLHNEELAEIGKDVAGSARGLL